MTEYIITTKSNTIAILSEGSLLLHLNGYNPYDEERKDPWKKVYICEDGELREVSISQQITLIKKFKKEKAHGQMSKARL